MPSHSPAELAARPAQRSLVLGQPTGMLVTAALVLGSLSLLLNALKLIGNSTERSPASGLLGLLLVAGERVATSPGCCTLTAQRCIWSP